MANESDALIREVQEELRREKFKKLWDDYGTYIIAAVVLLLVGIGGFNWWQANKRATAEAAGAQYANVLRLMDDDKNSAEVDKTLNAIADANTQGYSTLARLSLAGQAVEAGRKADAIKLYEAAAAKADDPLLKDFANLQVATLKIDTSDWTEMQNRLKGFIEESSPWRHIARELLGVAALRAGKLNEAKEYLAPLSADPSATQALREWAGALMNLVVEAEYAKTAPKTVTLEPAQGPKSDADKANGAKTDIEKGLAKGKSMLDILKEQAN